MVSQASSTMNERSTTPEAQPIANVLSGSATPAPRSLHDMHSLQPSEAAGVVAAALPGSDPTSEALDALSVPSTVVNMVLESGQIDKQQPASVSERPPGAMAHVNFWDAQFNKGHLVMMPKRLTTHTNIVLMGESGLGKTVRPRLTVHCHNVTMHSLRACCHVGSTMVPHHVPCYAVQDAASSCQLHHCHSKSMSVHWQCC